MIKTNIKLRVTPEQSKAVQKICFANGIGWQQELSLKFLASPYLFIHDNFLSSTHSTRFYNTQKKEEVDPDLFIRTNGTCIEYTEECQFAKYGFEKHKDCVVLTEVGSWLIGYVKNGTQAPKPAMWFKHDGGSSAGSIAIPNLVPIKKPWYETCKFPCLVKDEDGTFLISEIEWYSEEYLKTLTPLTNTQIEGLKQ